MAGTESDFLVANNMPVASDSSTAAAASSGLALADTAPVVDGEGDGVVYDALPTDIDDPDDAPGVYVADSLGASQ